MSWWNKEKEEEVYIECKYCKCPKILKMYEWFHICPDCYLFLKSFIHGFVHNPISFDVGEGKDIYDALDEKIITIPEYIELRNNYNKKYIIEKRKKLGLKTRGNKDVGNK